MRWKGIVVAGWVYTARGCFSDSAERTSGEMSICMKQIHVVATHCKINGIIDIGNLIAKIEIGRINKRAIFANKYPHRTRGCVKNIQIAIIQNKGSDASPVRIREIRQRNGLWNLTG